ncbi:hypothetical protein PYCCODRAFT_915033 [Trametes coccinea BRFM310]|uniref:Uncharacterized protein n=1 Tax=Trametes coccinea (strain BRFM310) TaxID=1353009 RepID=A0A1Y2ICC1_TRAC3|nr:hypothetical protein PYCCODRAFT_915033 [Trametes coccinea BRFM310]
MAGSTARWRECYWRGTGNISIPRPHRQKYKREYLFGDGSESEARTENRRRSGPLTEKNIPNRRARTKATILRELQKTVDAEQTHETTSTTLTRIATMRLLDSDAKPRVRARTRRRATKSADPSTDFTTRTSNATSSTQNAEQMCARFGEELRCQGSMSREKVKSGRPPAPVPPRSARSGGLAEVEQHRPRQACEAQRKCIRRLCNRVWIPWDWRHG